MTAAAISKRMITTAAPTTTAEPRTFVPEEGYFVVGTEFMAFDPEAADADGAAGLGVVAVAAPATGDADGEVLAAPFGVGVVTTLVGDFEGVDGTGVGVLRVTVGVGVGAGVGDGVPTWLDNV
jgi:hypothetical protein